jgi:hypothetical protein
VDELILGLLLLLGLRKREPTVPTEPDEPPPDCGPGERAVWSARRGEWQCIADGPDEPADPSEPTEPAPQCDPGFHAVWSSRRQEWQCVADVPDAPDEPDVIQVPDEPEPGGDDPTDVDDLIVDYPRPARFYQVRYGDNFMGNQGIATRLARSALYLAATERGGLDQAAANAWAAARMSTAARRAVTDLLSCTPINDWRYGTWAFTVGVARPGPHGRAIRLLPIHFNDRARLAAGDGFSRNIRKGQPGDPPSVSQGGVEDGASSFEFLWLPGIDLQKLWESNGQTWDVGGTWSDGSSQVDPPPAIWAQGMTDYSGSGQGVWGCAPYQREIS